MSEQRNFPRLNESWAFTYRVLNKGKNPKEVLQRITTLNYAATAPKIRLRKPVCPFSMNVPMFKAELCSGKSQNTIRPPQNLLEPIFPMHFDNTSLVRTFQVSSQGMPLSGAIQTPPGNGAPTEKLTPHAHTNT